MMRTRAARASRLAALACALLMLPCPGVRASECGDAASAAESEAGLPPGLLRAIGRVETGRFNPATGQTEPWPWSTNMNGTGHYFASKAEAMAWTQDQLDRGQGSIDVGCFQINLHHHPDAFANLTEAFDPGANARYAAQFLTSLYRRAGGWQLAAAYYHSMDPFFGTPYGERVFGLMGGGSFAGPPAAGMVNQASAGVVRMAFIRPAIQVFLPSWAKPVVLPTAPARRPPMMTLASAMMIRVGPIRHVGRLPQVFTPS